MHDEATAVIEEQSDQRARCIEWLEGHLDVHDALPEMLREYREREAFLRGWLADHASC